MTKPWMIQQKLTDEDRAAIKKQHWDWLQFIALCALGGITIGVIISVLIIHNDINGLGSLLARSPNRLGFTLLMTAGFASTFGMVAMGTGIMIRSSLPENEDNN